MQHGFRTRIARRAKNLQRLKTHNKRNKEEQSEAAVSETFSGRRIKNQNYFLNEY